MKTVMRVIKDYYDVEDDERIIFPGTARTIAVEVTTVTTSLVFDLEEGEWTADATFYGHVLTAKGQRDKRSKEGQLFGFISAPERRQFMVEYIDKALELNGLTRADVPSCAYLFKDA